MHKDRDALIDSEREPTAAEVEAWQREDIFLPAEEATADLHPALYNISAGMILGGVIRPTMPELPDYVAIAMDRTGLEMAGQVGMWNILWEAGQFRRRFFDEEDLPAPIAKIADLGDINAILVPRTESRYFEYEPLFHLLPKATLERFGLPLLRRGQWPFMADYSGLDRFLPADFGSASPELGPGPSGRISTRAHGFRPSRRTIRSGSWLITWTSGCPRLLRWCRRH